LYLTNRQRIGFYDQYRTVRYQSGGCRTFVDGLLHTTGLLIHLVEGRYLDVLPADNTLSLSAHDAAYEGDLFSQKTLSQLTPWTRPSINGTSQSIAHVNFSWQAVDRIRRQGDSQQKISFDYIEDVRLSPVIRADSWMTAESNGLQFQHEVIVTDRSTLIIETEISIMNRLEVQPGSRVVIRPGGRLFLSDRAVMKLKEDSQVVCQGVMFLRGSVHATPGSALRREGEGRILVDIQ